MPNFRDFAMGLIQNNPQIANNPQAKSYLDVLQSGDSARMKELAMNICNTYGMSTEQAGQQAMQFFGFGGRQ